METESIVYRIRVGAHLDHDWSEWFGGMQVTYAENGDSFLTGAIKDQAMLYGVLTKLYNLGLQFISVTQLPDQVGNDEYAKKSIFNPKDPALGT